MDDGADNTSLLTAFSVCSLAFFWNHARCEHLGLYSVVQPSDGCRKASRSSKTSSPSPHCTISAAFGMATKLVCLQESFDCSIRLRDWSISTQKSPLTQQDQPPSLFESLRIPDSGRSWSKIQFLGTSLGFASRISSIRSA